MNNLANRFLQLIEKAQRIVISTHIHPDADGIGSQVALTLALKEKGKDVICVNEEKLLSRYEYLTSNRDLILSYEQYILTEKHESIDLFIIVDTNASQRIGSKMQSILENSKRFLIIDHHPCPKELAAIHCIDTKMAATGELVGTLIQRMGIEFTPEMALPLYTAIIIDTSSFRYPTVSWHTHQLVSNLLKTGIQPPEAYNLIYGTKKVSHMQLLGRILSEAQVSRDHKIAWLSLDEKLLADYNVDPEDTHAFINHLLILDNISVACMFKQEGKYTKVSFRSAGQADVGIIAQALGGGGHNHSAATLIEGKMELVIKETIADLEAMLAEDS